MPDAGEGEDEDEDEDEGEDAYYLPPTTYHLLPTTCYLLPATCYLLPATCLQLVNSMRYGQTLYIRLADSACDFKGMFSSADRFPLEVFDRRHVSGLQVTRMHAMHTRSSTDATYYVSGLRVTLHPAPCTLQE